VGYYKKALPWVRAKEAKLRRAAWRLLLQGEASGDIRSALLVARQDEDEGVRYWAGRSLVEARWKGRQDLVASLQQGDAALAKGAVEGLAAMGAAGWPWLRMLLRHREERVVEVALRALRAQKKGAAAFCEELVRQMRSQRWMIRRLAAEAMGEICVEKQEALGWLSARLSDASEEVRMASARALGEFPLSPLASLEALQRHEDWRVRQAVAVALGGLISQSKDALPRLGAFLEDSSWAVRRAAAESLGRFGALALAQKAALQKRLRDKDRDVVRAAMKALLLMQEDRKIREKMLLGWLEGRGIPPMVLEVLTLWRESAGVPSSQAKGRMLFHLRRLLRGGDAPSQIAALRLLQDLPHELARGLWPELVAMVRQKKKPQRYLALRSLALIPRPPASLLQSVFSWASGSDVLLARRAQGILEIACPAILQPPSFWQAHLKTAQAKKKRLALRCLRRSGWRALPSLPLVSLFLEEKEQALRLEAWRLWGQMGIWGSAAWPRLWEAAPAVFSWRAVPTLAMSLLTPWRALLSPAMQKETSRWLQVIQSVEEAEPLAAFFWLPADVVKKDDALPKLSDLSSFFLYSWAKKSTLPIGFWWACVARAPYALRLRCGERLGEQLEGASEAVIAPLFLRLREAPASEAMALVLALRRAGSVGAASAMIELAKFPNGADGMVALLQEEASWKGVSPAIQPPLREAWSKLIASERPERRLIALRAASAWPQIAQTEEARLVELLGDPEPQIAALALELVKKRGVKAYAPLLSALRREGWRGREAALSILSQMGKEALPLLRQQMQQGALEEKIAAAYALAEMGREAAPAKPELAKAIRAEQQPLRIAAALALSRVGIRVLEAERLLRSFLNASRSEERLAAAEALARLDKLEASTKEALQRRLEDPDEEVRAASAIALLRQRILLQRLWTLTLAALASPKASLQKRGANAFLLLARALQHGCKEPASKDNCRGLHQSLQQEEALSPLANTLAKLTKDARLLLLQAFAILPRHPPLVIQALLDALRLADLDTRLAVIRLLGEIGYPAAPSVPALLWLLREEDRPAIRKAAIQTLAKLYTFFLGIPKALREATTDINGEVAESAKKALHDIQIP
jgi:HEAT repeat protein